MEEIRSSEKSGATQRTTRRHIPEDDTIQLRHLFLIDNNNIITTTTNTTTTNNNNNNN
jgi:hypothetical protein